MSYNDFLATFQVPQKNDQTLIEERKGYINHSHEYDKVRFGLPRGPYDFEGLRKDRDLLIGHFLATGYATWPSEHITNEFRKGVAHFRACLDLWEAMCPKRAMSKEEIYFRCLKEGPAFTDWLKKARSTSFRYHTSETNTIIDEEYLIHDYSGYNCTLSERYLIHWDDTKSINDIQYAFIPAGKGRPEEFRKRIKKLFEDFRIGEVDFPKELDMIGALKNSVIYDPVPQKRGSEKKASSVLMRELWMEGVDYDAPYFATRRVVPTLPGQTRDTGVGDPSTIFKVKQLNMLARVISERLPYSANAPEKVCNARLKRVLKRNAFLHLDFKKFGLTWPRQLMNIAIEEIGEVSGLDVSHLIINDFFVEIEGEVYHTNRGTMLGWLDSINSLCCCAILHWLSQEEGLKFDFITFNDDVEISKYSTNEAECLELLRTAVVADLSSFDTAVSLDKSYGSKGSVFLERYAYYERHYMLDMYKEQLTVLAYANSLTTTWPWQAKMFFAAAEQWTKNTYATDRCIDTCPVEFRKEEIYLPLWAGGWYIFMDTLDRTLQSCDGLGYYTGLKLSKWKNKKYSLGREKTAPMEKIADKVNSLAWYAEPGENGMNLFGENISISDINTDVDLFRHSLETLVGQYSGRNQEFPLRVSFIVKTAIERLENG